MLFSWSLWAQHFFWNASEYKSILLLGLGFEAHAFFRPKPWILERTVAAEYPVDTLFSMALQCQVKDAFSATQDKSDVKKVQALITVCAVEWSSMLNILSLVSIIISWPIFVSLFPIVKLSDFVSLNYLATTFLNLATVFLWKSANADVDFFSISSPADPTIRARRRGSNEDPIVCSDH